MSVLKNSGLRKTTNSFWFCRPAVPVFQIARLCDSSCVWQADQVLEKDSQIPHTCTLMKREQRAALRENLTTQKTVFRVKLNLKLNLEVLAKTWRLQHILDMFTCWQHRGDRMNCIWQCINRSLTLQQVANFAIVFGVSQWNTKCVHNT